MAMCRMNGRFQAVIVFLFLAWPASSRADEMPWIAVSKDKKGFVLEPSGQKFTPWGFNYDHDGGGTQAALGEEQVLQAVGEGEKGRS